MYLYQVVAGPLLIRDAPFDDIVGLLQEGETFTADLTAQAEAGDYLWARHERGVINGTAKECAGGAGEARMSTEFATLLARDYLNSV